MLRIFVEIDDKEALVALHGRLSATEVVEVEEVISAQDRPVKIDLAHLTGADTDGFQALRRLRVAGARVEAPPFIEMMLERTEAASGPGEPDPQGGPKGS